jgi:predicted transcriptional regulator
MSKDTVIQIRVEPEIKAKLQKMADKDNRKLSDYVRLLIINAIKNK